MPDQQDKSKSPDAAKPSEGKQQIKMPDVRKPKDREAKIPAARDVDTK
jgi:hypothetical protein